MSYPSNRSGLNAIGSSHISLSRCMEYIGMTIASPSLNSIPLIVLAFVHSLVNTVAMLEKEIYKYIKTIFYCKKQYKAQKGKNIVLYVICLA